MTLTGDIGWITYITNIIKRANSTVGFLEETSYIALTCPVRAKFANIDHRMTSDHLNGSSQETTSPDRLLGFTQLKDRRQTKAYVTTISILLLLPIKCRVLLEHRRTVAIQGRFE
ncbi:hypothetical protein DPMN_060952, partial [Dreissena polymorpha]